MTSAHVRTSTPSRVGMLCAALGALAVSAGFTGRFASPEPSRCASPGPIAVDAPADRTLDAGAPSDAGADADRETRRATSRGGTSSRGDYYRLGARIWRAIHR